MYARRNKVRIWLIRHGKTDTGSSEKLCIGRKDLPLSREGRNSLRQLGLRAMHQEGEFLKNAEFFTSPLQRAADSGRAFLKGCGLEDRELKVREGLKEVDLGSWDGLSFREIRERFPEEYRERGEHPGSYRTPGGETPEEAGQRFYGTLEGLIRETDRDLVIFAHSGVIRTFRCIAQGISCDRFLAFQQPYGSVTELVLEENGRKISFCERLFL